MACDLIELSGLVPHKDIKIEFSGLRPGEKLFEELLTAEEGTTSTKHQKIFVANLKDVDEEKLYRGLAVLKNAQGAEEIISIIIDLIPTYKSARLQYCIAAKAQPKTVTNETYHGQPAVTGYINRR